MSKVLLIVTGSISAYKAVGIASGFQQNGDSVNVILTKAAEKFITAEAFNAILHGKGKCYTDENWFDFNNEPILHIDLVKWADEIVVAPLSANSLNKMANGIADNLATCAFLAAVGMSKRIFLCPAMNPAMYANAITSANRDKLKSLTSSVEYTEQGNIKIPTPLVTIYSPVQKELACGDIGIGALPPARDIIEYVTNYRNKTVAYTSKEIEIIKDVDVIEPKTNYNNKITNLNDLQKVKSEKDNKQLGKLNITLIVGSPGFKCTWANQYVELLERNPNVNSVQLFKEFNSTFYFDDSLKFSKSNVIIFQPNGISESKFRLYVSKLKENNPHAQLVIPYYQHINDLVNPTQKVAMERLQEYAILNKANLVTLYNFEGIYDALGNCYYKSSKQPAFVNKKYIKALCQRLSILVDTKRVTTIRLTWDEYLEKLNLNNFSAKSLYKYLVENSSFKEKLKTVIKFMEENSKVSESNIYNYFGNISMRYKDDNLDGILMTKRMCDNKCLRLVDFVFIPKELNSVENIETNRVLYYVSDLDVKPSKDSAIYFKLYDQYKNINYIHHNHTYPHTSHYTSPYPIPCGDLREADWLIDCIGKAGFSCDDGALYIRLLGHGSLVLANDIDQISNKNFKAKPFEEFKYGELQNEK